MKHQGISDFLLFHHLTSTISNSRDIARRPTVYACTIFGARLVSCCYLPLIWTHHIWLMFRSVLVSTTVQIIKQLQKISILSVPMRRFLLLGWLLFGWRCGFRFGFSCGFGLNGFGLFCLFRRMCLAWFYWWRRCMFRSRCYRRCGLLC